MKHNYDIFFEAINDYGEGHRFATQTAVAEACGITKAKMNRWQNEANVNNVKVVLDVAERLGCTLLPPNQGLDGFDLVPKVAARCGAGGSLEVSDEITDTYAFRASFFGRNNISARNAVIMEVTGDSMESTIFDGDTVLIDQGDKELRDGYIYVVTLGDELKVKRIQKAISSISLLSDNPKYSPVIIENSDFDTLIIHGRVRWIGRNL